MKCPECGYDTKVFDSKRNYTTVMRKRKCLKCGFNFCTKEIIVPWDSIRAEFNKAYIKSRKGEY